MYYFFVIRRKFGVVLSLFYFLVCLFSVGKSFFRFFSMSLFKVGKGFVDLIRFFRWGVGRVFVSFRGFVFVFIFYFRLFYVGVVGVGEILYG